jgi:hypothetical protein
MTTDAGGVDYQDRTRRMAFIGVLLLAIGGVAAFLGPVEMYTLTFFSEGGRFHYEGFGFGSFMFGNIATQIVGYYLIAMVLIPLGYGHLRARRWARTLSLTLLGFWLVVGVPLIFVFLFILFSAKELSLPAAVIALVIVALSYPAIPILLIRFYQSRSARLTFERSDPKTYWTERRPLSILVLSALFALYLVALHILIFFNGLFPVFGIWLSGLEGIVLLDMAILCLACLIWGTMRMSRWAWWSALVYFTVMAASWVVTLATSSWSDILVQLDFPPFEVDILEGLPFQGWHFAVLVGIPLALTLGVLIWFRRDFEPGRLLWDDETSNG